MRDKFTLKLVAISIVLMILVSCMTPCIANDNQSTKRVSNQFDDNFTPKNISALPYHRMAIDDDNMRFVPNFEPMVGYDRSFRDIKKKDKIPYDLRHGYAGRDNNFRDFEEILSNVEGYAEQADERALTENISRSIVTLSSDTIYVPDDYTTIQRAVNAASDGDTIIVSDGTYTENIKVKKRLTIKSENGSVNCIIHPAKPHEHIFTITDDYVNITGFTIEEASSKYGLYIYAVNNCNISNNVVLGNKCGIYLSKSSRNTIANNTVKNNKNSGIGLVESNNNRIIGNDASNTVNYNGIELYTSTNNEIRNNIANYNHYMGIALWTSSENIIANNTAKNNGNTGIGLMESNNNRITDNDASNYYGIVLTTSNNNVIRNNKANYNHYQGIVLWTSDDNIIANNTAKNNGNIGIYIKESSNNNILGNNAISNNNEGISLKESSGNSITDNNCSYNGEGIFLDESSDNSITDNNCSYNRYYGIRLLYSGNNEITGNTMFGNGIYISGSQSDYYQEIDTSNTVNGKPVYYWNDVEGGRIPEGAGQVILVNCKDVVVENQNLNNASCGIVVAYCLNIAITNNNCSYNDEGISLKGSSENNIKNNNCSYNDEGISLSNSGNNEITNNNCSYNDEIGISLWNSSENSITNNNFSYNNEGISLRNSGSNVITANTMFGNGIYISGSQSDYYQEIDTSNTVNGKPVYYWKDIEGGRIPEGAGQVILVNCKDVVVENQNLNNAGGGIEIALCANISIRNNNCSYNNYGIRLYDSSENSIRNNNCSYNDEGIYLEDSANNNITGNTLFGNGIFIYGIWDKSDCYQDIDTSNTVNGKPVYYWKEVEGGRIPEGAGQVILVNCKDVVVENQNLNNAGYGIVVAWCSNITIKNNDVSYNKYGIYIYWISSDNTIKNNHFSYNKYGIGFFSFWGTTSIYLNNFINNNVNVWGIVSISIGNNLTVLYSKEKITYIYNGKTYKNYMGNYWSDYNGTDANSDGIGDAYYSTLDKDDYPLMEPWENYFAQTENIFDTCAPDNPYPSTSGTHHGTITLNQTITVSTLYTYPCAGTGGHTEYAKIGNDSWRIETQPWEGYKGDWHNISFSELFKLYANETYDYTIRTGSYPQIHHTSALLTTNGWVNCTEFMDGNGKKYNEWIPAIRLG